MFERISNTWTLMRACWDVLRRDKALILFPLFSGICCIMVIASFAVPFFLAGGTHPTQTTDSSGQTHLAYSWGPLHYVVLFLFYFCNYFVITFFNSAIIACAVKTLRGEPSSVGDGMREAFARIHLIAGWALLSATVGVILRAIEDKSSWVGKLVAGFLGIGWAVASYLVVPVLIVENKGPIAALKESTALLKKTWGERIVGSFSFSAIFGLLVLPAFLLVGIGVFAAASMHNVMLLIATGAIAATYFVILMLVQSALAAIFQAAIYLYARDPQLLSASPMARGFPVQLLARAMKTKQR